MDATTTITESAAEGEHSSCCAAAPHLAKFAITLVAIVILFILKAGFSQWGYWRRRNIKGPASKFFIGQLDAMVNHEYPAVYQLRQWTNEYGSVYGVQQCLQNVLVLSDPSLLHEVFVKRFEHFHGRKVAPIVGNVDREPRIHMFNARGARWKRLRSIANPVFSVSNLKKILPVMNDSFLHTIDFLAKHADTGDVFNIHPYFHEFTMDVISRIAMGQQDSRQFRNEKVELAIDLLSSGGGSWIYASYFLPTWIIPAFKTMMKLKGRLFSFTAFEKLFFAIDAEVQSRIKLRRLEQNESSETTHADTAEKDERKRPVDFIDLFLDAAASEDVGEQRQKDYGLQAFNKSEIKTSKSLTPTEVTSQLLLFILAGFDTTANSLALTCHYLALDADAQQRLRDEIDTVFGDDSLDEQPTYEQLHQLRYADAVMKETLRLQPIAASVVGRQCAETTQLSDGTTIEAGTYVQADVFSVHYSKEVWGEDAEKFRPERWLNESKPASSATGSGGKLEWFPFGAGPRVCIGMRMAIMEEKLALVHLFRRYQIERAPGSGEKAEDPNAIRMKGTAVLNPVSVPIRLIRREP